MLIIVDDDYRLSFLFHRCPEQFVFLSELFLTIEYTDINSTLICGSFDVISFSLKTTDIQRKKRSNTK